MLAKVIIYSDKVTNINLRKFFLQYALKEENQELRQKHVKKLSQY